MPKNSFSSQSRPNDQDRPEIADVRYQIFSWSIYPFLLFGLISIILGSLQAYRQGQLFFSVLYIVTYLIFFLVTLSRKRLNLKFRSVALILFLTVLAISVLVRVGLSGIGLELLLFICTLASIMFGRRVGYIMVGFGALAMVIVAWAMISGALNVNADNLLTSFSPIAWATSLAVFCVVGLGLVFIPQTFLARLEESLALVEERSEKLERSNQLMAETLAAREEAESALRISEEKYRVLVENAGDAIFIAQDGILQFGNKKAKEVSGYTFEEMVGRNFSLFIHPEDQQMVLERHYQRLKGMNAPISYSFRALSKDGTITWAEINSVAIEWEGKPATLNFLRDITDRLHAEQKLRESEEKLARSKKMESIGLLAGGVAHDLNNVLSGVVNYPELILMNLPGDSELRQPIETIKDCGNKAVAIVQDLLTVARGVAVEKHPMNLNDVINKYIQSPEHQKLLHFHPAVEVRHHLDPDLMNIKGSWVHIGKTLMNLVSNAAEAIIEHGTVTITTGNLYLDNGKEAEGGPAAGEYVVLSVTDSGSGMSQEEIERIFEPFYSKKVMGRSGTGLGLAVVWNIIQDHQGYVDVQSGSSGSAFKLYFPITREMLPKQDASVSIEDLKGNGEHILIVDDEKTQRDIFSAILKMLGYQSVAVSSGEKAVDYLQENTVDLVLLDMIMEPGIDGCETYRQIIETHPGQKALIASGYADTEAVKEAQRLGAGLYLKKPVSMEKLGMAIIDELGKR